MPAARKPLYRPWLAANTFVSSAKLSDFKPKVFIPFWVVHNSISNIRMYKWMKATIDKRIYCVMFIIR